MLRSRPYIFFAFVRLYLCLCPSYLHPDEAFQGPEVIAGQVFHYPVKLTWEFTSQAPIRSVFPIFSVYGIPMLLLKWLYKAFGSDSVKPSVVFWTLRLVMLILSIGLEEKAIYNLFDSPSKRRLAVLLISSSYVTWTWQVHTFSNSVETIILCWSLVLFKRIREDKERQNLWNHGMLGFLIAFGLFNRITYLGFMLVPSIMLISVVWTRPLGIAVLAISCLLTGLTAVLIDSYFYSSNISIWHILYRPVLTPLNNLLYNSQASNLASHGTHPYYVHFLINLPQLIGPAFVWLLNRPRISIELITALSGILCLSLFPHQEARFLIAAIPLILASTRLPRTFRKTWIAAWIVFNGALGVLMGVYHQAGVVPAQIFLETQPNVATAFWWKTYSPPNWLLNGRNENMTSVDLMGVEQSLVQQRVCSDFGVRTGLPKVLVAPRSAIFLDQFVKDAQVGSTNPMTLTKRWSTKSHVNLDDMDFGDDGVFQTLKRVFGRRGLVIWDVECVSTYANIARDW